MNVVSFLVKRHQMLCDELEDIRDNLPREELYGLIKKHISHIELFEGTEEKLFTQISRSMSENRTLNTLVLLCEQSNTKKWALLDHLMDSIRGRRALHIERDFFVFQKFMENHNLTVKLLYPVISNVMDAEILEVLGRKADEAYARFYEPVREAAPLFDLTPGLSYPAILEGPRALEHVA